MNREPYGKKCKCGHEESFHVNHNKKFYEPNAIPEMGYFMSPPPTFENPKDVKCKLCNCDKFSPEKKSWGFWK